MNPAQKSGRGHSPGKENPARPRAKNTTPRGWTKQGERKAEVGEKEERRWVKVQGKDSSKQPVNGTAT